ncbi:MAG: carboxymuconolactone decarboxylase family protein [Thermoleophilia bacterium]|nr:carboxymuconolactone decarboxylase family protein [Thermoleophilia bacterium]
MEDIHPIFTRFKSDFPEVYTRHEALGREIHENSGPLDAKTRALIKVAVAAATGHQRALETQLQAAREAGTGSEEITQALLLIIPTCGFPAFMEAYTTLHPTG